MYLGVNNHHNHNHNNNNNNNNNSRRVRRHHLRGDKGEEFDQVHHQQQFRLPNSGFDPLSHAAPDHHPASAGSLRRHIAASLMRHHQTAERNKHALQPLSPASYGSSLEMAPYNPAATSESSIELRGRFGETSYNIKTSTELLKVLNRIWTLEEQHTSNISIVKSLKNDLDHARVKIKELLRDQQGNRHKIDHLMKKISTDNLDRKNKDHERMEASLQSVRDELENERKLRKRSESLHRKLGRELFEVKVALSTTVKEYEKEKNSSDLLEQLCDKFAKGIQEYAKELHISKQKSDTKWTDLTESDNLVLHMSESWLDERSQLKDGKIQGLSAIDKLKNEIVNFLGSEEIVDEITKDNSTRLRRRSLESIPEIVIDSQDSTFSNRALEVAEEIHPGEINMLQKLDIYDSVKQQRKKVYDEEGHGSNLNLNSNSKTVDKLISELMLSENEHREVASSVNSGIRLNASPIRQWMTGIASPDVRTPEVTQVVNDNSSLKARLQEPKIKGHRSRLKILKG